MYQKPLMLDTLHTRLLLYARPMAQAYNPYSPVWSAAKSLSLRSNATIPMLLKLGTYYAPE
jgi:hypothetical protein